MISDPKNKSTNILHRIKLLLHQGDKYVCPFCNYSSRDLAPLGLALPILMEKEVIGGGRRNGRCYSCRSKDRERLLYVYLTEKLKIFTSGKINHILHFAPEENLSKLLLDFGFERYICGDSYPEGLGFPSHVQNIDVLDIPFDDNSFDLILCNHVLEHVPDDATAMKELSRVLKKGGKAILQVPISKNSAKTSEDHSITDPEQRRLLFGQRTHVRIYGQDYVQRLEENGFNLSRVNISREFFKYGLNPDEDLFVCEKSN